MLTISKALSPARVLAYHVQEFTNARENYYTGDDRIRGRWHGRLAQAWDLSGGVEDVAFQRLADGQHPVTGAALVRHQAARTYLNRDGRRTTSMAHRAGWDATFSAPKSVSLTALAGGDARVAAAHRASVLVALDELERFTQARIGGSRQPETTGKWVAALFEHDSARPVDGYAAPHLHTHAVVFNVTERSNGHTRALQPLELFRSQQYATAVYRSELASRLSSLGYEIDRGRSGQPEIRGYTPEYLEASSPRRRQIEARLSALEKSGARAAHIAALQTRQAKSEHSHEAMQARHQTLAETFGGQPAEVVQAACLRGDVVPGERKPATASAELAMTFAMDRNFEREAVVDERALIRDALSRSMGRATTREVKQVFDTRVATGALVLVNRQSSAAGRSLTTPGMLDLETQLIRSMRAGTGTRDRLVAADAEHTHDRARSSLNGAQQEAVDRILATRDQLVALEGVAGSGKTATLAVIREAAANAGFDVVGLAPTSRAAQLLSDAGLATRTLQHHLVAREGRHAQAPRLYVLDESSLVGTRQLHAFIERLRPRDRVVMVGDVRQHHAVEAGRPYQQLQQAGMSTVRLDRIVRQRDPALKTVVDDLASGRIRAGMYRLQQQRRVHEVGDRAQRLAAIADAFTADPHRTLVVSPDHQSRRDLNRLIHEALQQRGQVNAEDRTLHVLVPRQEITTADRQWAARYEAGDVVLYTKGSARLSLPAKSYARVEGVDAEQNRLTVGRKTGGQVSYDPRRLGGVTVYREEERTLAVGDRVHFTTPFRARSVANGELGTLTHIDDRSCVRVRLDSGRRIAFSVADYPHIDLGYAVTSHTSQGQTADRVLVHVDTGALGVQLVNRRFVYVAVSCGRYDAQIYTDNRAYLAEALSRDVDHQSALENTPVVRVALQRERSLGM